METDDGGMVVSGHSDSLVINWYQIVSGVSQQKLF